MKFKSFWTCPSAEDHSEMRLLMKFTVRQSSLWKWNFKAESFLELFSFSVRAADPPLLNKLEGFVTSDSGTIAEIVCHKNKVRLCEESPIPDPFLSVRASDDRYCITARKAFPRQKESDVLFEERRFGPLARIFRCYDGTFREQLASGFGLGLCQVGVFQDGMSAAMSEPLLVQSFLAGLSLYFYLLESLYNSAAGPSD